MNSFAAIDLSQLPPPQIVEQIVEFFQSLQFQLGSSVGLNRIFRGRGGGLIVHIERLL